MANPPHPPRRIDRRRLVDLLLATGSLALLAALALFLVAATRPAPGPATATAGRPGGTTLAAQLAELAALLRQHLTTALSLGVLIVIAFFLVLAYFSRRASSVSLAFGFARFELSDALRELRDDLEAARASNEALGKVIDDFGVLSSSLAEIAAIPTRDEVRRFLGLCGEGTQQLLGSYKASVWLHHAEARRLRIYTGQRVSTRTLRHFSLAPDQGFAGHVFKTGKPLWLNDPLDHPERFVSDPYGSDRVGPILGVPIWGTNHDPVGVLCATHHAGGGLLFTREDGALAAVYANLISVALHLARLADVELWAGLDYR